MAMQPLGPLPASTYWRRRVVLLILVLIVLIVAVKACAGGSTTGSLVGAGGSPAPSVHPSLGSPAASAGTAAGPSFGPSTGSSAPGASGAPEPTASVPASPSGAAPTASAEPPACPDAVMQVTAVSDAQSYPSGSAPRFTLTVRNTGSVSCRRALGPAAVELRVLSGQDRIWSSSDCNRAKDQGVLTLAAGQARATTLLWPGKRSKPGCVTGATAQPGTYRVSARVGDIVQEGSVFRITG